MHTNICPASTLKLLHLGGEVIAALHVVQKTIIVLFAFSISYGNNIRASFLKYGTKGLGSLV